MSCSLLIRVLFPNYNRLLSRLNLLIVNRLDSGFAEPLILTRSFCVGIRTGVSQETRETFVTDSAKISVYLRERLCTTEVF